MITIPAEFTAFKSRIDRSWTITMSTAELSPQQVQELVSLLHEAIYVSMKADVFRKDELAMLDNLEAEIDFSPSHRTPSQRLRAVLYVLWQQDKHGYDDFQLFYNFKMEHIIEHFKSKLE